MEITSQRCTRRSIKETCAGRIGEHLAPFLEGPVGGDHGALVLITTADQCCRRPNPISSLLYDTISLTPLNSTDTNKDAYDQCSVAR